MLLNNGIVMGNNKMVTCRSNVESCSGRIILTSFNQLHVQAWTLESVLNLPLPSTAVLSISAISRAVAVRATITFWYWQMSWNSSTRSLRSFSFSSESRIVSSTKKTAMGIFAYQIKKFLDGFNSNFWCITVPF